MSKIGTILASSLTSSSALSDYHGSLSCSPVESLGSSPTKSVVDLLIDGRHHHFQSCFQDQDNNNHHHNHHLSHQKRASAAGRNQHDSLSFVRPDDEPPKSNNNNNNTNTNNNNNNLLHPLDGQHQQKTRSFSHSQPLSPLVARAAAVVQAVVMSAGKANDHHHHQLHLPNQPTERLSPSSLGSSIDEDLENRLPSPGTRQQQALSLPPAGIVERTRRPSRIEQRQSLHDLGYGRIESYFKLQRLGKGTYATVYMGRSRLSNDLVALKEILKEHDEGAPCTAIREVSLLRLLRHNNIVTLHDICHTPNKLTLVFEYVGPDLYAHMRENNHLLSISNVRLLLFQLLRGLAFCHARQVLHRDLKPQNLLINSRGELKICDFGLARAKSIPTKHYSNEVVTLWYRPPDVLLGNTDYDHSIDMWGVGCIFYEMASGRTFFPGRNVRQQLYLIFSSLGAPTQSNWPELLHDQAYLSYSFPSFRPEKLAHLVPRLDPKGCQLLQKFLRFKPNERLSADEAKRDPFFSQLPEALHHLNERESIFDVPGVFMTLNPGQKLNNNHKHHHH